MATAVVGGVVRRGTAAQPADNGIFDGRTDIEAGAGDTAIANAAAVQAGVVFAPTAASAATALHLLVQLKRYEF